MLVGGTLSIIAHDLSSVADLLFEFSGNAENLDKEFRYFMKFHAPEELKDWLAHGCDLARQASKTFSGAEGAQALKRLDEFFDGGGVLPNAEKVIEFEEKLFRALGITIPEGFETWKEFINQADERIDNVVELLSKAEAGLAALQEALCKSEDLLWKKMPARNALLEIAAAAKDGAILVADIAAPALVPDLTLTVAASSVRSIWKSSKKLTSRIKEWKRVSREKSDAASQAAFKSVASKEVEILRRPKN